MSSVIREEIAALDPTANGAGGPDDLPIIAIDMPVLFEDEGQEDKGDTRPHSTTISFLHGGIQSHLSFAPEYTVLSDMNLYYHPIKRWAYISPDVMAVRTTEPLPRGLRSYRIGRTGPAPVLTVEVLSERSVQQQDLTIKPDLYHEFGVAEYIIVDVTGDFFSKKLEIWKRDGEGWDRQQDPDGGVTSELGFRIVIDTDDQVRVVNAKTGHRYLRPDEAERAADAARQADTQRAAAEAARQQAEAARVAAEARVRELEAEVARLRGQRPDGKK